MRALQFAQIVTALALVLTSACSETLSTRTPDDQRPVREAPDAGSGDVVVDTDTGVVDTDTDPTADTGTEDVPNDDGTVIVIDTPDTGSTDACPFAADGYYVRPEAHGCDCRGEDLSGIIMIDATLTDCDFSGATIVDGQLDWHVAERVRFDDATLTGTGFGGGVTEDVSFFGANLEDGGLGNMQIRGAGLNLECANLRNANISRLWCSDMEWSNGPIHQCVQGAGAFVENTSCESADPAVGRYQSGDEDQWFGAYNPSTDTCSAGTSWDFCFLIEDTTDQIEAMRTCGYGDLLVDHWGYEC